MGWESCNTTWLNQKFPNSSQINHLILGWVCQERQHLCWHLLGWASLVIQFFLLLLLVPKQELNADFPIIWGEMNTILIFVWCLFSWILNVKIWLYWLCWDQRLSSELKQRGERLPRKCEHHKSSFPFYFIELKSGQVHLDWFRQMGLFFLCFPNYRKWSCC